MPKIHIYLNTIYFIIINSIYSLLSQIIKSLLNILSLLIIILILYFKSTHWASIISFQPIKTTIPMKHMSTR